MRIAMFTETYLPYQNGVVSHVVMLKNTYRELGHDVLVVTVSGCRRVSVDDGVLNCPGFRVDRQYGYRIMAPGARPACMDAIRAFRPDVIHIHNEYSVGLFALKVAKRLDLPVVYSIHMDFDKYLGKIPGMTTVFRPLVSRYLRRFTNGADQIVSMSPKSAKYVARTGVDREIELVPNAVEPSVYADRDGDAEQRAALRRSLGIAPETNVFISVGRLDAEKSVDVLIDSFAALHLDPAEAVLLIAGTGKQENRLRELARPCGAIRFLGAVPHESMRGWYKAADYYLTASLSEMHSIAMLEAMASGLYTLMRYDADNVWQIATGQNGEIWYDRAQLGQAVRRLLASSPEAKEARRQRAMAWSAAHGRLQQAGLLLSIYERALAERDLELSAEVVAIK